MESFENLVLQQLQSLEEKLDDLRTTTIPNMKTEMAVEKALSEQRMSKQAKWVGAATFLLSMLASIAVAYFK